MVPRSASPQPDVWGTPKLTPPGREPYSEFLRSSERSYQRRRPPMFGDKKAPQKAAPQAPDGGKPAPPVPLLTVVGDHARMEGKFEIADSIQIECEVGGELNVGVKLVIGGEGAGHANGHTGGGRHPGPHEGKNGGDRDLGGT